MNNGHLTECSVQWDHMRRVVNGLFSLLSRGRWRSGDMNTGVIGAVRTSCLFFLLDV